MNLSWGIGGLQGGGLQRGRAHAGAGELGEEVGWDFGLPVVIKGELELGKRWASGRFAPESKYTFRSWRTWCGGGLVGLVTGDWRKENKINRQRVFLIEPVVESLLHTTRYDNLLAGRADPSHSSRGKTRADK